VSLDRSDTLLLDTDESQATGNGLRSQVCRGSRANCCIRHDGIKITISKARPLLLSGQDPQGFKSSPISRKVNSLVLRAGRLS
jgi:hypothetical protein